MKKSVYLSALCFALIGCGGSSDSQSESPNKGQYVFYDNSAPTLSITGTLIAKAGISSTTTLAVQDADNDTLTVSFDDQPQWLSYTINNTQLELTVLPGFFDLGTHELKLTLSDGTADVSYAITYDIEDNPDAWQPLSIEDDKISGVWSDTNNDQTIVFTRNKTGFWANEDFETTFSYFTDENKIALNLGEQYCFAGKVCGYEQTIEFQIIAEKDNQIRALLINQDQTQSTVTLEKNTDEQLQEASYISFSENTNQVGYSLSKVQRGSLNELLIEVEVGISIKSNYSMHTRYFRSIPLTEEGVVDLPESNRILFDVESSFDHYFSGEKKISINYSLDDYSIIGSTDNYLFTEFTISGEIASDFTEQPSDYFELEEALAPKRIVNAYRRIKNENNPNIALDQLYLGRLLSTTGLVEEDINVTGSASFKLTGATTGKLYVTSPSDLTQKEFSFDYQLNDSNLTVNLDNKTYRNTFYRLPDNSLALSIDYVRNDGTVYARWVSGINSVNFEPELSDYIGRFRDMTHSEGWVTTIAPDGKANYFHNYQDTSLRDIYKFNDDGSISIIPNSLCEFEQQFFDDCFEYASQDPSFWFIRLKFMHFDGTHYYASYMLYQNSYAYETIRKYLPVTE